MNTKILELIEKNLKRSFRLPKYGHISNNINHSTIISELPWTPSKYNKFKNLIEKELDLKCDFSGSVSDIVNSLDRDYLMRFFGKIWKPRIETYQYTGWDLIEEINKTDPENVLDVGCGYNLFKGRINNLIGIDPFNSCADYQIDILEYNAPKNSHDHIIALGSINFNSKEDIEKRFSHCVDLLKPGGSFWLRVNPGIQHINGPYVDVFNWTFDQALELSEKYNLRLLKFKKEANGRLFFVCEKR